MKQQLIILIICISNISVAQNKMILSDNFDKNQLDENTWNYELGNGCPENCGWGNQEKQIYTDKQISINNGVLDINVIQKDGIYKSSKITTKNKIEFTYGTVEVRAKLPTGTGIWPAIWLLGANIDTVNWPACGEIDMMEFAGKDPEKLHTTLHTTSSHGNSINTKVTIIPELTTGYHIYKMVWTEDSIVFLIDNQELYTYNPKIKNSETWPFDKPFYLIINTAVGGTFGGQEVNDSIFPQKFSIDYVKIYQ